MPQVVLSPPLNVSRNQVNLVKVMLQLLHLLHLLQFSTSVTGGRGGENTRRTVKKECEVYSYTNMYFWHRFLRHHKKKAGVEKKAGSSDLK